MTAIELPVRVNPHTPLRPLWLCRSCGAPWPCANARLALRCEFHDDRLGLVACLGEVLREATDDLRRLNPDPGPEPTELYVRFVGWTRRGLIDS